MNVPSDATESHAYYPNPTSLDDLQRIPEASTYNAQIKLENVVRRHKLGYKVICATLIPGALVFSFKMDQEVAAPATWGINSAEGHTIGASEFRNDGTGTLTITLPGLGIRDSSPRIAGPLKPAFVDNLPNSKLVALEEGTVLHIQNTINAVRETIVENNPGHLILYGMSTGGKEMLYVMAALREEFPDLKVTLIADSTPFTKDTAYELRNDPSLEGFAAWVADKQLYGGPLFNSIADLYFSSGTREKYINSTSGFDQQAYNAEIGRLGRDVWSNKGTPTALRIGQVALVTSNKMEEQLTTIAQDNPNLPPITFIYIANSADRTVDTEQAIAGYRAICNDLDMRFVVIHQEGLPHASENDFPGPYNQNITIALNDEQRYEDSYAKAMQAIKQHTERAQHKTPRANAPR